MKSTKTHSVEQRLMNLYRRYTNGKISRRDFLRSAAALGVSGLSKAALIEALTLNAMAADNPIVIENQQPGSSGWQLTGYTGDDSTGQLTGYASATSVNKGQPITFYVTVNPAQTFTIDIYRIGWYQGLGGRLLKHIGPFNGITQAPPTIDSTTGLIVCNWVPGYTLTVPTDWTSGIYLALVTNFKTYQSYIPFVVRDDSRIALLLYQQSLATDQAYNNYPQNGSTGKSLYEYNSYGANTVSGTTRAVKVSFDRPYNYNYHGAGDFLAWELYFVRWLERSGYDVAYSTDIDTHANGSRLLNYKGFLSVGHDEYWSKEMQDAAEAARDAGVNLAFFGADAVYWQVRFEASASGVPNRVMVCYKDATKDPVHGATTTVEFRKAPVNRPEQTLIGVQYASITPGNGYVSYVVRNSGNWVYAGTGFKDGDSVPGIVGYEVDRQWSTYRSPNYVAGSYVLLSQSPYSSSDSANSSIYQAPSGAFVFAAGTIGWSWGLDNYSKHTVADPRIQKTTANILDKFISSGALPGIAAPSNLTAFASSGSNVNLAWTDNSSNEEHFVIERSANKADWSVLKSVPANINSYADTVPSPGVYYYRVKATNTSTSSNYSDTARVDTQLLSPTGLSATSNNPDRVDLLWTDNSTDEAGFTVERSPNGSTNWTTLTSTLANVTSYSDTSLIPITTYYYRVKATNAQASSGYSNTAGITTGNAAPSVPSAPSNLSASRSGNPRNQRINLSWIDNSNNEAGFVIDRSSAADFTSDLVTRNVGANNTSFSDDTVGRSTTYYYRVKATKSVGSSGYSNVASARTR